MNKSLYHLLLISSIIGPALFLPMFPKVYFFHIIFGAILFLSVCQLLMAGRALARIGGIKKYIAFFIIWFLWILISSFWAENKALAIQYILIYATMFSFLGFLVVYNKDKNYFRDTLKIIFFSFSTALLAGSLEAFTSFRLPISPYANLENRDISPVTIQYLKTVPTSFFFNPNNYASFLSFSLPFILFAINYTSSKKIKIYLAVIALLLIINIIMTASNTNIVAVGIILFIYFLVSIIKRKSVGVVFKYTRSFVIFFIVFFMISGLLINANEKLRSRFFGAPDYIYALVMHNYTSGEESSISIRTTISNKIINPPDYAFIFSGYGVGNTTNYLWQQELPLSISSPHNWWLEILGDFGFFFFGAYLVFFFYLLKDLWRSMGASSRFISFVSASCFVSLLGFILVSVSPSGIAYFIPHWLLMGLSLITINLAKNEKYENSFSR